MITARRPYRTDLSDARWALIEPLLSQWRGQRAGLGIAKIQHDLREIVNAILYVNRTGIAWEYLPHDFPPYKTVYGYYAKWEKDGVTEAIHEALRGRVRRAAGRPEEPTAAIVDSQTVKTSSNVHESSQGIDAGKRIKGRYLELKSICPSRARRESKVRRIASWMGLPSAIHHGSGRFDARAACGHAGFRARVLDAVG
jgi:transposase